MSPDDAFIIELGTNLISYGDTHIPGTYLAIGGPLDGKYLEVVSGCNSCNMYQVQRRSIEIYDRSQKAMFYEWIHRVITGFTPINLLRSTVKKVLKKSCAYMRERFADSEGYYVDVFVHHSLSRYSAGVRFEAIPVEITRAIRCGGKVEAAEND